MLKKIIPVLLFLIISTTFSFANNLKLNHFDVVSTDTSLHRMTFTVDLTQDNSWRNALSHDAVWLFMKYSTDGGQSWHHATLAGSGMNPPGFSAPPNFELLAATDMKGFFLRRTDFVSGSINAQAVKFVWNYAQNGMSDDVARAANTLTKVYGIEMVYIPEGSFFAGDGVSASLFRFKQGSADDKPWYITGENSITTANVAADGYYYQSTGAPGENSSGDSFLISNSFPKGYKSFYLMKYELTEGEWVSFFNTLAVAAKVNRDMTSSSNGRKASDEVIDRNTVAWDSSNPVLPAETLRTYRAMSYVSWPDVAAFADWACLRPMTEFEFEKAARGVDVNSVSDEFAWGSSTYNAASAEEIFPSNQDENGVEAIFDGAANLNRNELGWTSGDGRSGGSAQGQKGPLRVGIFAESTTSRVTSGAGYYGNMELSGNLTEPVVTVGRIEGRQFLGTHGDGELTTLSGYEGFATNVDWPGIDSSDTRKGVNKTIGIGYRGGDFQSSSLRDFQISSRAFTAKDPDSMGLNKRHDLSAGIYYGGRLARTAQ